MQIRKRDVAGIAATGLFAEDSEVFNVKKDFGYVEHF